jgi:hypothetical protein
MHDVHVLIQPANLLMPTIDYLPECQIVASGCFPIIGCHISTREGIGVVVLSVIITSLPRVIRGVGRGWSQSEFLGELLLLLHSLRFEFNS